MEEPIAVSRLDFGTLFKIVFWAGMLVWIFIALLFALVALLVPSAITVNGVKATSAMEALPGVPMVLIPGLIGTLIFAGLGGGLLRILGSRLPLGSVKASK